MYFKALVFPNNTQANPKNGSCKLQPSLKNEVNNLSDEQFGQDREDCPGNKEA